MQNETNIVNFSSLRIMGQYNCGAYGSGTYDSACTTATSSDTGGGFLADTGYNVLLPVALGVAVLIAGIILLVKRLRRRNATNRS